MLYCLALGDLNTVVTQGVNVKRSASLFNNTWNPFVLAPLELLPHLVVQLVESILPAHSCSGCRYESVS